MDQLQSRVQRCVEAGIRAYIGLLCSGEQERSRRIFHDTMQLSCLSSGGPSAPVHLSGNGGGAGTLTHCLMGFSLQSLLTTLLVLRATAWWARVPELSRLLRACDALAACLQHSAPERAGQATPVLARV